MKRVTIEDVAKAAGVSRQTVSRAINDKGEISEETKARVMQAVEELGYRPNRLAQGMVTQRTFTIGLVVADITNPFFPEVTRGVQDTARAHDHNVFLCNTDDNVKLERRVLHSLAAQGVDGIILFAAELSDAELTSFADTYRPIVLINRVFEHASTSMLIVDNYHGGQLAADYFIDHGHTALGMLTARGHSLSEIRRVQGFQQQAAARGVSVTDDHIVAARPNLEGGYQATQILLDRYSQTTAIFTYNDLMALGTIRACGERGLRIPQDIALIGFDDIRLAAMATPALSSIRVDKYAIGQMATQRLLAMIDNPDETFASLELDVDLVIRESA